jgi:ubiquinol-cytochrome c reductase cytochrome b subunit
VLVVDCIVLGFCGANPPEGTWLDISRIATAYYFAHFFVLLPIVARLETPKPLPFSISEPVLKPAAAQA